MIKLLTGNDSFSRKFPFTLRRVIFLFVCDIYTPDISCSVQSRSCYMALNSERGSQKNIFVLPILLSSLWPVVAHSKTSTTYASISKFMYD